VSYERPSEKRRSKRNPRSGAPAGARLAVVLVAILAVAFVRRLVLAAAIAVALAAAVGAAGCAGDAAPASRIVSVRVLGARIEVAGDPARTVPRPGESAHITWLTVAPGAPRPLAWSFFAVTCPAGDDAAGCLTTRAALPLAAPAGESDGHTPPTLDVVVPALDSPDDAGVDRVIIGGVVCGGGAVADPAGPPWSRCASAASDGGAAVDETDVVLAMALQVGAAGDNAPPTLADDPITWDGKVDDASGAVTGGMAWTAGATDPFDTVADQPCATAPGAPAVAAGKGSVTIVVAADAADREATPPPAGTTGAGREGLQLSVFSTRGTFDSHFAGVESDDARATTPMTLEYTPPKSGDVDFPADLPPEGRTVRFFFVLRDLRGGIDWQARTLCLLPPGAP